METRVVEQLKGWVAEYIRGFAENGELPVMIRAKAGHSWKVAELCSALAGKLGLDGNEIRIAYCLGLFHDIGRFSQFATYRTFDDQRSVNHAKHGLEILEKFRVLAPCPPEERVLIEEGIRHHNIRKVPDSLDARTLRFARLVRDADKLDITRLLIVAWENGDYRRYPELMLDVPPDGPVSPEALAELRAGQTIGHQHIRSTSDFFLTLIAWVHDYNFPASLNQVRESGFLEKLAGFIRLTPEVAAAIAETRRTLDRRCREAG